MRNKYYALRHGESIANQRGLIVSKPHNALDQYGLSDIGRQQVLDNISTALDNTTPLNRKTLIVSSDFARAHQTAVIVQRALNTQSILLDKRLRERDFGDYELQDHAAYVDVWEEDLRTVPDSISAQAHGVETVASVLGRSLDLISELESQFYEETILLVGHGDVLQITLAHFAGVEPRLHRSLASLGNAQISPLGQSPHPANR